MNLAELNLNVRIYTPSKYKFITVKGKDSIDLLDRLTTNDLKSLKSMEHAYSLLVSPKGRMIEMLSVLKNIDLKMEYLISGLEHISQLLTKPNSKKISGQTGTKKPKAGTKKTEQKMEELEMISNNLMIIPWTEPWNFDETRGPEIEALRIRPMKYLKDFCSRYVLRPLGPTKLLQNIIRFILTDPKNQNFHVQSKRAYIYTYDIGTAKLMWFNVTTKQFYDEFRVKLKDCYTKLVLAPHFHINGWAMRTREMQDPVHEPGNGKDPGRARPVPVLVGTRKSQEKVTKKDGRTNPRYPRNAPNPAQKPDVEVRPGAVF